MNEASAARRDLTDGVQAPLDHARLADVLRGSTLSPAAFLADFRRSIDVDAARLEEAARTGDLALVGQLAHRIEGASKVIGAVPIADACSALGQASRSDSADLRSALQAFVERRQALCVFLDAMDQERTSPDSTQIAGGAAQQLCAGLTFLVVEDHDFQRGMIMRLLRQLGAHEVQGFVDGAAALVAARAAQVPLILVLDLAMPAPNGMEVMRIAALEQLAVTVIMNSAMGEDLLQWPLQTARSYGADVLGAVSKPLTAAKLAPLLASHRHRKQPTASPPAPLR